MACPYFAPESPDPQCSPAHATLPLGDAWSGQCHADPATPWQPGTDLLYSACNIGYARTRCPRCPEGGPDSVRFAVRADEGATVQIYYVVERDHLPFAHGPLEYAVARGEFQAAAALPEVVRLARAYVSSYFRRRAEASAR